MIIKIHKYYIEIPRPFGMAEEKKGFKPEWTDAHAKDAADFQDWYKGDEPGLGPDEYVKWLYDVQQ